MPKKATKFGAQVDQALRGLNQLRGLGQLAQEALPLAESDPKVTRREQRQTRCLCRRPRQRPAMVSIFVLANPREGNAQLLVECARCHAAWVWGAR